MRYIEIEDVDDLKVEDILHDDLSFSYGISDDPNFGKFYIIRECTTTEDKSIIFKIDIYSDKNMEFNEQMYLSTTMIDVKKNDRIFKIEFENNLEEAKFRLQL